MTLRTVIGTCTLLAISPFAAQAELNSDGNWEVQRGDTLYSIARELAPGNGKEQARLRKYMFENSPEAFINGQPSGLEARKTLMLPGHFSSAEATPAISAPAAVAAPVISAPVILAPVVSVPSPKPVTAAPLKARLEARRQAKEQARRKKAEAARRLAAEQAAAQQATREEQARREAQAATRVAQQRERDAAKAAAAQASAQASAQVAAERAAKQQAAEQAAKERALRQAASKTPRPASTNTPDTNPYKTCLTTNPKEDCGYWR